MAQHHKTGEMRFYEALARVAREQYNQSYALGYRERDDDVECPMHKDLCDLLALASDSFKHPISVLDLGCGTGRYFHCLQNTERIVGVDASADMLAQAQHPVRASKIKAWVDLIRANIFEVTFSPQSFDLIYSLGVLGQWCPLDEFLLEKVETMLKGGGKFIFTVVDARSPKATSWRRIIAQTMRPFLPLQLRYKRAGTAITHGPVAIHLL